MIERDDINLIDLENVDAVDGRIDGVVDSRFTLSLGDLLHGILSASKKGDIVENLDTLPMPARDLVNLASYDFRVCGERATSLMSSFGCPMGCTFYCGRDGYVYRKLRAFSPKRVLQEFDVIRSDYPMFTALMDYADEWNLPAARAIELAEAIAAHPTKFKIRCFIKAEHFTDAVASAMARAGVVGGADRGRERLRPDPQGHQEEHDARDQRPGAPDGEKVRDPVQGGGDGRAADLGIERSRIVAGVEGAIAWAQRVSEERAAGQMGLFATDGASSAPEPDYPDVPAWDAAARLEAEHDVVGFYISGHPLDRYLGDLDFLSVTAISRIDVRMDEQTVKLAGVVNTIKLKNSKKGERYATFILEDRDGILVVIAWPDAYKRCEAALAGRESVLVTGRVEFGERRAAGVAAVASEGDDAGPGFPPGRS